jgi:integrase
VGHDRRDHRRPGVPVGKSGWANPGYRLERKWFGSSSGPTLRPPALPESRPTTVALTCAKLCRAAGGELEQIQMLLGHASVQTAERYLGTKQDLVHAPND